MTESKRLSKPWLIVAGDFASHGGMDRANYELARYIAENQQGELHLVAHRVAEPLASMPGVIVHQVARPAGRHILGSWLLARTGRRLAHDLATVPSRVIINGGNCRWPGVNWVHYVHARCACQNRGAPWIFGLKNSIERQRGIRNERKAFRQSQTLIANSHKTRHDLIELHNINPELIKVVYLGCDPSQFGGVADLEREKVRVELNIAPSDKVLLFVGVLGYDRNKGFDTLLEAFRQLRAENLQKIHLIGVGAGRLEYWQKLSDSTGFAESIRLLGARSDVPNLMAAADALVSPTRYDSYGLAVHEALCRGLPAIVSRAAGVSERYPAALRDLIVGDPEDAAEFARRITRVLSDRNRYQPALDELSRQLRGWSWRDMAAQFVGLLEAQS